MEGVEVEYSMFFILSYAEVHEKMKNEKIDWLKQ